MKNKLLKYIPLWSLVLFCVALSALVIHVIALNSIEFSDFFNRYISSVFRAAFSYVTLIFPFSLAELIIIAIPLILVVLIVLGVRAAKSSVKTARFCFGILSIISIFYSTFIYNYGVAYHGTKLEDKLGLERKSVSADELYDTELWLINAANELSNSVAYADDGFSVMPYSLFEMNEKLMQAYGAACDKYDFLQDLYSRIKPVMLSRAMSYTHITGIYSFYTGEANVNIDFPSYSVAFTAAHELAHQRGIAREDEANFVAFLVLKDSDDDYLKYCAYVNMLEYVGNSLYSASPEKYFELYKLMGEKLRGELAAYGEFFEKYANSKASEISGTINDTYLKLQGTQGSMSYGLVTDLAVAYCKSSYFEGE